MPVRRRQEEGADDLRLFIPGLSKVVTDHVGGVEEHTAAGASRQAAYDIHLRLIRAHTETGPFGGRGQGFGRFASLQLRLQAARDQAIVIDKSEPAQSTHPLRYQAARNTV